MRFGHNRNFNMNIKPRNFDKNVEKQLLQNGICTKKTLDKYTVKEKIYYFNQLYIGAVGRRKHPYDEHAFSLPSKERRKKIATAARLQELRKDIPLIEQVCNHVAGKWSDGYIVTKCGYDIFSQSCNTIQKGIGLENGNKPYNPPRNGIRSRLDDGRKCNFKDKVPNETRINTFSLFLLMMSKKQQGNNEHMINQIELLLATVKASKSGCLPTTYIQSGGGRFYAEGSMNLQNCSREIRKAALVGHYDIDIDNCHYTLLGQMCKRINIITPYIDHYIKNKKAIREEVARFFKCSEKMAKEILISLIYGSNLTNYGVLQKLGINRVDTDIPGCWIDKLAKEVVRVRTLVINDYSNRTTGHFKITNEAGMTALTKCVNDKCVKKTALLAHILHGAESLILQHMIGYLGDNIVLLQHDGVTCRKPVDTDELSNYIAEKTGYLVKFDIAKLALTLRNNNIDEFEPVNLEKEHEAYAA